MKRFLIKVTMFCLLQAVIAVVVLSSAHLHFRKGYLAALEDKVDLLESDGPPRILFVGGSSVAFGIDSERFASMRRQPVNLGLNASLGLDFCATLVERHVRPGDLVVLMPEHSNLLEKMKPHPTRKRSLLRQCPRAARYLDDPWPGPKTFLDQRALPEFGCWTQAGIERLPSHFRDAVLTPLGIASTPPLRVYSRASFNRHGDMIAHHGIPPLGKPDKPPLVVRDREKLFNSIARLNRCIGICQQKSASVVFAYPPISQSQYEVSREAMLEITAALQSQLRCPIVTQPDTAVYSLDHFFDQVGHLTEFGKRKHTGILVDGLARYETEIANNPSTIMQRR